MSDKPTIGRIVHFYNHAIPSAGPYPAMVIQTFDGPYVNLLVHAWGGDWREGSVEEKSDSNTNSRCWVWPPRV